MDDPTCSGTCLMKTDLQNTTDKLAFLKDKFIGGVNLPFLKTTGPALDKLKVLMSRQNRILIAHFVSLMSLLMSL